MTTTTFRHWPSRDPRCPELAPVAELCSLTGSQMDRCCRELASAGRSDPEIAALIGWHVIEVRRALSRESCA